MRATLVVLEPLRESEMSEPDRRDENAQVGGRVERRALLRDLAQQSQETGTYDDVADDYKAALAEARSKLA